MDNRDLKERLLNLKSNLAKVISEIDKIYAALDRVEDSPPAKKDPSLLVAAQLPREVDLPVAPVAVEEAANAIETSYLNQVAETDAGIRGSFDGLNLVTLEGETYEVPANYAAKTKLVCGDTLIMQSHEGRNLFKVIDRVPTIEISGIAMKKDDGWFILNADKSYKISDAAADFNKLSEHCEVKVLIPENSSNCNFATFVEAVCEDENKGSTSSADTSEGSSAPKDLSLGNLRVIEDDDLR
ncbi:hypothetical protein H6802_01955 [Candidatus Nomurabacteria bacterium]|uniref:50S ribosomal protein L7/L12 n=1 Tax=candidate division WWE3 bacterium TaxID=2053526 RepID=A0A955E1D2_UNCKA|nr:hypothetical protein [candidate division WWE3 bacterium]MCB9823695.1 hypothetical protein [Candidatus Nomurabacteria bacterium]MCB9827227.1 hypothetical protein [Candidatus Nomurabacteria bacterium]MCB9827490.1 hypothetical protein [Candidatus Nomurabacteria bacterium]HXK52519.1 hypothetical protein [bacterium]